MDFVKGKRRLSRHKKGQQKQTTYDFSASRVAIGIPNANAQQIASALVGDHKFRDSHQSPTNENITEGEELFEKSILSFTKIT